MNLPKLLPNTLGARIVVLMTLAMLPLGLISIYQTRVVIKEAQALTRAALMDETIAAASEERELIQQALGAAQGLAAAVAADAGACGDILARFIEEQDLFIFAGFVTYAGMMNCSSSGATVDFSDNPRWLEHRDSRSPRVSLNLSGVVTKQAVILTSHPVLRDGDLLGRVTISIPHWIANALLSDPARDRSFQLASLGLDGNAVAASGGLGAAPDFLPRTLSGREVALRVGQTFRALAGNGEERFFAVAPMIDDALVLVGSWPATTLGVGENRLNATLAVVFPVLMWAVGIGVAFFGLQRLVVVNVKQLRSAMRRFALGDRDGDGLALQDPPEELAEAERAFNRMALIISDAEARQEEDLRDKEVLLREVHHRVKNNLQLIASIMNMQGRNARSAEAKRMLAGLQRRVRGLAMLHRTLYTTPDMTTIDAAELVRTVVADVSQLSADARMQVETELESIHLYPDQAVPLSMLLAEALTNAVKYAGRADGAPGVIRVSLASGPGRDVSLQVCNSVDPDAVPTDEENGDGLGNRLMTAFVQQLDGTEVRERTETSHRLSVSFPRRGFDPAGKG